MMNKDQQMLRLRNVGGRYRHPKTQRMIENDEVFLASVLLVERMEARGQIGSRFVLEEMDAPLYGKKTAQTDETGHEAADGEKSAGNSTEEDEDGEAHESKEGGEEDEGAAEEDEDEAEDDEDEADEAVGEYRLRMKPRRYLKMHPDGRHAAAALAAIAAEEAEAEDA